VEIGSLFGDRITQDMQAEPLKVWKATLARMLKKAKPGLQFSEHITVPGQLRRPAVLKARREFFDAPPKLEGLSVKPAIMAFVHAFIAIARRPRIDNSRECAASMMSSSWSCRSGAMVGVFTQARCGSRGGSRNRPVAAPIDAPGRQLVQVFKRGDVSRHQAGMVPASLTPLVICAP
jgi:hypothetical protein